MLETLPVAKRQGPFRKTRLAPLPDRRGDGRSAVRTHRDQLIQDIRGLFHALQRDQRTRQLPAQLDRGGRSQQPAAAEVDGLLLVAPEPGQPDTAAYELPLRRAERIETGEQSLGAADVAAAQGPVQIRHQHAPVQRLGLQAGFPAHRGFRFGSGLGRGFRAGRRHARRRRRGERAGQQQQAAGRDQEGYAQKSSHRGASPGLAGGTASSSRLR